ncbi:MAG: Bax inhibitor-1/YccA family protein [Alphaproteobacteria bacterium]
MKNYSTTKSQTATIDEGLRSYFIKVYNYMAGGLLLTAIAAYLVANTSLINAFFTPTGMSGLGWIALLAPIFMIFGFGWVLTRGTLAQVQGVFWGFSALMGISISPILIAYTGASVTRVFLITSATFGAMSLYGYTTKKDLSGMGSFMMMGLWGIIIASIVNIFMKSSGMYYALSYLTVAVFVGLTAWDTQKIRLMYSAADSDDTASRKAISGALSLYMDFINMFLALLRIMGDRR